MEIDLEKMGFESKLVTKEKLKYSEVKIIKIDNKISFNDIDTGSKKIKFVSYKKEEGFTILIHGEETPCTKCTLNYTSEYIKTTSKQRNIRNKNHKNKVKRVKEKNHVSIYCTKGSVYHTKLIL